MAPDADVMNITRSSNKPKTFTGCLVSYSQLPDSENKKELKKKVKKLGGKSQTDLTGNVTHLITMDWFSLKSRVIRAKRRSKPIVMTPKWIEAVSKQSGNEILPATHHSFLIHRLPIFHGFTLCFSQVSLEKRAMLRQKVERNGGKYSGDFNPSVVTHLILVAPEGKKYDISLKFNKIKKVNAQWFTDSLKYGLPLLEEDYPAINLEINNSQSPQNTQNTQNMQDILNTSKRKSGDSFPNMADFLSCKKNKSNLFNNSMNRSIVQTLDITSVSKKVHNISLEKADEFDSILKDLGNLKENYRRISASPKPRPISSQNEKRKLALTKIQSSQLSDKITESLPVLWEGST